MSMLVNPYEVSPAGPAPLYRGQASIAGGSSVAAVFPAGAAVGDFALVIASNGFADPGSVAGWLKSTPGVLAASGSFFTKFLTSGDLASPPSWPTTTGFVVSYVFANVGTAQTSMFVNNQAQNGSGTTTFAGVANKPASCLALIGLIMDQTGPGPPLSISWPNIQYDPAAANAAGFAGVPVAFHRLIYNFTPTDFVNGSPVAVHNVGTGSSNSALLLFGTA